MKTLQYILLLFVALLCAAQIFAEEEEKKEENPFGVNLEGQDEKILDPHMTAKEKVAFTKFKRASKDKNMDDKTRLDFEEAKNTFAARWCSGSRKWTPKDFDERIKAVGELYDNGDYFAYSAVSMLSNTVNDYVALRDDVPENMIARMREATRYAGAAKITNPVSYRKMVSKFLEHDKFKDATPRQKYQFVYNYMLPKLVGQARKELEGMAADLKEEAEAAEKPKK